ncbi:WRKY Transcription Factor, partial [Stylosanthes scabra]|nr:WRKY Transcription Factor [Stylosanthes scabra]
MAMEFISVYGYGGYSDGSFNGDENNDAKAVAAMREAACGGIKSVEKLMDMISEHKNNHHQKHENDDSSSHKEKEFGSVADAAVNRFKEVISILDNNNKTRTRLGHARFRRARTLSSSTTTTLLPNNNNLQQM